MEIPSGKIYGNNTELTIRALGKLTTEKDFRDLIGATDPAEAAEGTIRKRFAESKAKNASHGSDSDENAALESAFFFTTREQY